MSVKQYPFIDVAVHERVRLPFARGEAVVLFSGDMDRVLWSNGRGAALFGHASIYDFLDAGAAEGDVAFRQLTATARQVQTPGAAKGFLMRIGAGFRSVPVNARVERILVRPGDEAILFSAPVAGTHLGPAETAEAMLSGFDDPDTHMAVLDGDGAVIVASNGFNGLDINAETRRALVNAAGRNAEWLVKRPIATGKGQLPAAIGRIASDPPLHLLFAVETILGHLDAEAVEANTEVASDEPQAIADLPEQQIDGPADQHEPTEPALSNDTVEEDIVAAEEPMALNKQAEEAVDIIDPVADDTEPANDVALFEEEAPVDAPEYPEDVLVAEIPGEVQDQHEEPAAEDATIDGNELPGDGFVFNREGRPVRFVWKIDAEGRFSEISDEFASAVGPHAASIAGERFTDVASRFDLDPGGKIGDLLRRRDTWSGKTIFWPVEGTNLVVPVDLAALPTYSRNREFDGFRGFGIVRITDAAADPNARGLSLVHAAHAALPEEEPVAHDIEEPVAEMEPEVSEPETEAEEPTEIETASDTAPETTTQPDTEDAFRGERPALRLVETPARRQSDKVVQFEARRGRSIFDGLSTGEQAAFREIARQLGDTFGKRKPDDQPKDGGTQRTATDQAGTPAETDNETSAETTDSPTEAFKPVVLLHEDRATRAEADDVMPGLEVGAHADDLLPEEHEEHHTGEQPAIAPPRTSMDYGLTGAVVDALPVALLVHVGDRLIHANPEFLKLTGYKDIDDLEEAGGLDVLLDGPDAEAGDTGGIMTLRHADTETTSPVRARLQSIRWEDGTALMLALSPAMRPTEVEPVADPAPTLVPVDIEERNAEQAAIAGMRIEVSELRSILETATDGVVVVGQDGEIRSMNRSASALFNYDEEETRGRPFAMLFAHESQKAVLDYLSGLSGHGVASVLNDGREVIGREASGGFIPLFMTMGRLSSSTGFCAVIRDITQWKRTEEELRTAKRAAETANAHKSDFLARVSHEIRTPLNAIIGFSDMMATERFGPIGHPRYVEYANDIGRSGRHVLDIVNDLLDISKIEAGEMDLDFTAVGLNETVSEAVSIVQPQANGQRVIVRTSLSNAVPQIVADLRSIKQIALNILSNAIRFTPAGGQIVVSTAYEPNGSVVLRIRDTGVGMTRSELEQAMKPFRQVTTGSRKRGDGTGLGLPLTKAMVDANRANFAISSTPDEGTLVEVTFPSPRVLAD
jgi:PAS domain S-box-containing protein